MSHSGEKGAQGTSGIRRPKVKSKPTKGAFGKCKWNRRKNEGGFAKLPKEITSNELYVGHQ